MAKKNTKKNTKKDNANSWKVWAKRAAVAATFAGGGYAAGRYLSVAEAAPETAEQQL